MAGISIFAPCEKKKGIHIILHIHISSDGLRPTAEVTKPGNTLPGTPGAGLPYQRDGLPVHALLGQRPG